jgi:hypothetical protein
LGRGSSVCNSKRFWLYQILNLTINLEHLRQYGIDEIMELKTDPEIYENLAFYRDVTKNYPGTLAYSHRRKRNGTVL